MPPAISLLCLPCAGGSATMYLRWKRLVPAWLRIVPVELPGRGARLDEPCEADFETLVARLCDEQAAELAGSHALFGHSMGGLLAQGIAHWQRERGARAAQALFVSASPAPACRDPGRFAGRHDDAWLVDDLRRQGGTPEEVLADAELRRLTLSVLRADYGVCDSFTYQARRAPLDMPLHAFGGRDDEIGEARLLPWRDETRGPFALHWFSGGHFFIREHEAHVLDIVGRVLSAGPARAVPEPAAA